MYSATSSSSEGPSTTRGELKKLQQYGGAEVQMRYLADAQIPSYSQDTCPLCETMRQLGNVFERFKSTPLLGPLLASKIGSLWQKPVSIIAEEERTRVSEKHDPHKERRLLYRWYIEVAKEFPAVRHFLATVVRSHTSNPPEVLSFFRVLAAEQIPSRFDNRLFGVVFYKNFRGEILRACEHFLNHPHGLAHEDLVATLCVHEAFDRDSAAPNYMKLLHTISPASPAFLAVAFYALLSAAVNEYPAIAKATFQEVRDRLGLEGDVHRMLDDLVTYWTDREKDKMADVDKRLHTYRELQGGRFHNLNHLRESLLFNAEVEPTDLACVLGDWNVFRIEVGDIVGMVRQCIAAHVTSEAALEIEQTLHRAGLSLSEGNAIVAGAKAGLEAMDPTASKRLALDISQSSTRLCLIGARQGSVRSCSGGYRQMLLLSRIKLWRNIRPTSRMSGLRSPNAFPKTHVWSSRKTRISDSRSTTSSRMSGSIPGESPRHYRRD